MTPITTTLEIEALLIEYMIADPDLPDLGPVFRVASSFYNKTPDPEGYCDFSKGRIRHMMVGGTTEAYQARKRVNELPESECFSTHPQVVGSEPLVDPVDSATCMTDKPHSCPFADPCSS